MEDKRWKDRADADSGEISDHERCIRQLALSVDKNVKFHSSLLKVSLSIAKNAIEKEKDSNF